MRWLSTVAIATILATAGSSASATDFHCGKSFITFPVVGGDFVEGHAITVRKSEIMRVFGSFGGRPTVIVKVFAGDDLHVARVDETTRKMIVECLD